jgi:outer membrane biogenesis lipoprotein LolB
MRTLTTKKKMQAAAFVCLGFVSLLIGGCNLAAPQGADVSNLSKAEQDKMFQNQQASPKMEEMRRKHGGQGRPAAAGAPAQGGAPAQPR